MFWHQDEKLHLTMSKKCSSEYLKILDNGVPMILVIYTLISLNNFWLFGFVKWYQVGTNKYYNLYNIHPLIYLISHSLFNRIVILYVKLLPCHNRECFHPFFRPVFFFFKSKNYFYSRNVPCYLTRLRFINILQNRLGA